MGSDVQALLIKAYVASAAVNKYRFVKVATSTMKVSMAGDDEMAVGIALEAAAADGDVIGVALLGIVPIEAVEAIAANDGISCGANGKGEKSEADSSVLGVALQDIAQDEVGAILLIPVKALAIAS